MNKRLMRDSKDVKIAGVCSGIAKYLNIDPTLVRVIWGVAVAVYGVGIVPYLICWWVMPLDRDNDQIMY